MFDERGSWVTFSIVDGKEINRGRLPFKGKNTGTWRGANSWAISEDNKKLHLLNSKFELASSHKIPGPVNFARESISGWIWTGWRHDGSETAITPRYEIGLWIDENEKPRVLSNDGKWHDFSCDYSSSSELEESRFSFKPLVYPHLPHDIRSA